MISLVLVLLALLVLALAGILHLPGRDAAATGVAALLTVLLAVAVLATALEGTLPGRIGVAGAIAALVLAAAGGGVVTVAVFRRVDAGSGPPLERPREGSLAAAGLLLRGGAWIGALERVAVFASIAARWPEGIAVALALKGLGRYPELRANDRAGAAERFIIGTMVSLLWAIGCAYVALGPALVPADGGLTGR